MRLELKSRGGFHGSGAKRSGAFGLKPPPDDTSAFSFQPPEIAPPRGGWVPVKALLGSRRTSRESWGSRPAVNKGSSMKRSGRRSSCGMRIESESSDALEHIHLIFEAPKGTIAYIEHAAKCSGVTREVMAVVMFAHQAWSQVEREDGVEDPSKSILDYFRGLSQMRGTAG